MNPKSSIKIIKRKNYKSSQIQPKVEVVNGPNRWSNAVRFWVDEFQQHRHAESLPAFDSLFKDALLVKRAC